jgi:sugar/nucleoside kinase (ribokinase family)
MDPQPSDPKSAVLVAGAASRDIDPTDRRGWRLGGTVSYGSLVAARLGLRVRALIGVDREAATAHELELLRAAGVEIELVSLRRGPVFENVETDHGRLQFAFGLSDRLPAAALPAAWRTTPAVVLGPVAGELGADWATALPADSLVALGWQGLFRRLVVGRPVTVLPLRRGRLLARADLAVVSGEDAAGGGANLRDLLHQGQQLVITGGARGALHVERTATGLRSRAVPAPVPLKVVDPTGAGDVLLAAWCAGLLALRQRSGDAAAGWRPLALAMAAASLTVEAGSLAELPDLAAARERLARPLESPSPSR